MGIPWGVVANVLDCDIVVSEFELKFGKGLNTYPPSYGLHSTSTVLQKIGFGIKYPKKIDMPLKTKEPKGNADRADEFVATLTWGMVEVQ